MNSPWFLCVPGLVAVFLGIVIFVFVKKGAPAIFMYPPIHVERHLIFIRTLVRQARQKVCHEDPSDMVTVSAQITYGITVTVQVTVGKDRFLILSSKCSSRFARSLQQWLWHEGLCFDLESVDDEMFELLETLDSP